jgi:hypothetical protein
LGASNQGDSPARGISHAAGDELLGGEPVRGRSHVLIFERSCGFGNVVFGRLRAERSGSGRRSILAAAFRGITTFGRSPFLMKKRESETLVVSVHPAERQRSFFIGFGSLGFCPRDTRA